MEITTKSRVPERGVMQALYYGANLTKINLFICTLWHVIDHSQHHKPSAASPLTILTWDVLLMHPLHQLFWQTSYCSWFRPLVQHLPIVAHAGCLPSDECISELGKGWILPPAAVVEPSFINPSFFAITVQSYISGIHPWASTRQELSLKIKKTLKHTHAHCPRGVLLFFFRESMNTSRVLCGNLVFGALGAFPDTSTWPSSGTYCSAAIVLSRVAPEWWNQPCQTIRIHS